MYKNCSIIERFDKIASLVNHPNDYAYMATLIENRILFKRGRAPENLTASGIKRNLEGIADEADLNLSIHPTTVKRKLDEWVQEGLLIPSVVGSDGTAQKKKSSKLMYKLNIEDKLTKQCMNHTILALDAFPLHLRSPLTLLRLSKGGHQSYLKRIWPALFLLYFEDVKKPGLRSNVRRHKEGILKLTSRSPTDFTERFDLGQNIAYTTLKAMRENGLVEYAPNYLPATNFVLGTLRQSLLTNNVPAYKKMLKALKEIIINVEGINNPDELIGRPDLVPEGRLFVSNNRVCAKGVYKILVENGYDNFDVEKVANNLNALSIIEGDDRIHRTHIKRQKKENVLSLEGEFLLDKYVYPISLKLCGEESQVYEEAKAFFKKHPEFLTRRAVSMRCDYEDVKRDWITE